MAVPPLGSVRRLLLFDVLAHDRDGCSLTGRSEVSVDREQADLALRAWTHYGKGRHPAALNNGDCFAYALATSRGAPLLFVGDDFTKTDVKAA